MVADGYSVKSSLLTLLIICGVSIVSATLFYFYSLQSALVFGVASLFLFFVKDIRWLVPILLISCPFGPKFGLWFGNLYLTTAILLIAYLALLWRAMSTGLATRSLGNPVGKAMLLMLGVMMASMLGVMMASMVGTGFVLTGIWTEMLKMIQFIMYTGIFIMVYDMDLSVTQIKWLLGLTVLIGAIEAFLGILQIVQKGSFISGTFEGLYTAYGLYMTFVALVSLSIFLESSNFNLKIGMMALFIVSCLTVIFSFCRTAYIALPSGLLTFLFLPLGKRRKLGLLIGMVTAATILPKMIDEGVIIRAKSILLSMGMRRVGVSFGLRLRFWQGAFSDFLDHPIVGGGLGSYGLTDSLYMKLLAETGLVGFVVFLWLVANILWETKKMWLFGTDDDFIRGVLRSMMPATIACVVIFNVSTDFFMLHRFMGIYWTVLALSMGYMSIHGRRDGRDK